MSEDNMLNKWQDRLLLTEWTITTEAIEKKSVTYADDVPDNDKYFVGIQIDKESMQARIYHDIPLTDEHIVHELLHVKFPLEEEEWINKVTTIALNNKHYDQQW